MIKQCAPLYQKKSIFLAVSQVFSLVILSNSRPMCIGFLAIVTHILIIIVSFTREKY